MQGKDTGESLIGRGFLWEILVESCGIPCSSVEREFHDLGGESFSGAGFCFGGFFFPVPWGCGGFQRMEKTGGDSGYVIDRSQKGGFVCLRGLVEATDLSYELEGGGVHFLVGYGRIE